MIREALLKAQQDIIKMRADYKRSPPRSPPPSSTPASKRLKTSHATSRPSSSAVSTTQHIKDMVAASRSELESKRKHSISIAASSSSPPPAKPLSPYERFIAAHWEDDEYDGLGDDERRSALNKRFQTVSFSKKEAWTTEWQREMQQWETDMKLWTATQGVTADSGRDTADHGTSSGSRYSSSGHKHITPARQSKPVSSSSTAASSPTSSSTSASQPPSHSNASADYASSPLIAHQYFNQAGQVSLVPHINKYHKSFLTLTFPISRITALVSLLPQPATPPSTKLFPLLTVATISRAVDYFIQHVSALVLVAAVASGSKVLRPEDYRAVILRRNELWWLRWAQEDDRDVRGRYRTGQLAAVEKKRRDAEDRARGRILMGFDAQADDDDDVDDGQDVQSPHDEDGRRMEDERDGGSRMAEDDDGEEEGEDNSNSEAAVDPQDTTQAEHDRSDEPMHTVLSTPTHSFNDRVVNGEASE